ncbi:MAG: hypothetical protein KF901_03300 [Myxococcales bacterium]|nr:hypothetical protein [Myxococcales bacterium]
MFVRPPEDRCVDSEVAEAARVVHRRADRLVIVVVGVLLAVATVAALAIAQYSLGDSRFDKPRSGAYLVLLFPYLAAIGIGRLGYLLLLPPAVTRWLEEERRRRGLTAEDLESVLLLFPAFGAAKVRRGVAKAVFWLAIGVVLTCLLSSALLWGVSLMDAS